MTEQYDEPERLAYTRDELAMMQQIEREHISAMWGDASHYPGAEEDWNAIMSGTLEDYARAQGYDIQ
jgi:hypothetical protein